MVFCAFWLTIFLSWCSVRSACQSLYCAVLCGLLVNLFIVVFCAVWLSIFLSWCSVRSGCQSLYCAVLCGLLVNLSIVVFCAVWLSIFLSWCSVQSDCQLLYCSIACGLVVSPSIVDNHIFKVSETKPGTLTQRKVLNEIITFDKFCSKEVNSTTLLYQRAQHTYIADYII